MEGGVENVEELEARMMRLCHQGEQAKAKPTPLATMKMQLDTKMTSGSVVMAPRAHSSRRARSSGWGGSLT